MWCAREALGGTIVRDEPARVNHFPSHDPKMLAYIGGRDSPVGIFGRVCHVSVTASRSIDQSIYQGNPADVAHRPE